MNPLQANKFLNQTGDKLQINPTAYTCKFSNVKKIYRQVLKTDETKLQVSNQNATSKTHNFEIFFDKKTCQLLPTSICHSRRTANVMQSGSRQNPVGTAPVRRVKTGNRVLCLAAASLETWTQCHRFTVEATPVNREITSAECVQWISRTALLMRPQRRRTAVGAAAEHRHTTRHYFVCHQVASSVIWTIGECNSVRAAAKGRPMT